MGMSYRIKQQVMQEFLHKGLIFLENSNTGFSFSQSGKSSKYVRHSESRRRGSLFKTVVQCAVQNNPN